MFIENYLTKSVLKKEVGRDLRLHMLFKDHFRKQSNSDYSTMVDLESEKN